MRIRYGAERKETVMQAVQAVGADAIANRVMDIMPEGYQHGDPLQVIVGGYRFRCCVVWDALILETASPVRAGKKPKNPIPLTSSNLV